jgi:RND family efflux transporter MFP subunit
MGGSTTAIPVQVEAASQRTIAQHLETNGTLEAENDVDLVARTAGPIVELSVEEGMLVERGQLLARIDAGEVRARLRIDEVALAEAELILSRAQAQFESEILSRELFDQAASRRDAALAAVEEARVQLGYTEIVAPFGGLIVERFIKFAEHVQNGTPLFRISDFDPLQCPIQVPEKDLGRLALQQPAYLTVEAFPEERFQASVLRISPVVDSTTGTVKVTLEVEARGRLRPGMFASVFLETDRRENVVVIPKSALVLESIGDTVYVKVGDVAERREVRLGYDDADHVEVVEGLEVGDQVIVLGQDSVSSGTPVYVPEAVESAPTASAAGEGGAPAARPGPGGGGPGGFDPANLTEERLSMMRERMKSRGMSDDEIAKRIEAMKRGESPGGGPGGARRPPG